MTFGRAGAVRYDALELDALGRPGFTLVHGDETPTRSSCSSRARTRRRTRPPRPPWPSPPGSRSPTSPAALSEVTAASPWRMEVHERADGMVVVNDAYNANPDSMRAALEALVAIGRARGRRTVAVLGQMLELGTEHEAGHRSVGTDAVRLGVDVVVVVGGTGSPDRRRDRRGRRSDRDHGPRGATRPWPGCGRMPVRRTSSSSRRPEGRRSNGSPSDCWVTPGDNDSV